jgi:hypothetical protein
MNVSLRSVGLNAPRLAITPMKMIAAPASTKATTCQERKEVCEGKKGVREIYRVYTGIGCVAHRAVIACHCDRFGLWERFSLMALSCGSGLAVLTSTGSVAASSTDLP